MVRIAGISPGVKARSAGVFYLLIFIAAPSGAATATPARMLVTLACDTAVALLLYDLLEPISRSVSLLAALFRLIFVAMMAVNSLNFFGYVTLARGAHSAAAFGTGYQIAMAPFGVHCLLVGWLIFRSAFLPRFLGVLMAFAGLGWLAYLWPPLAMHLYPYILAPGILGEGSLTLWLLVRGLNEQVWRARAVARTAKPPTRRT